MSLLRGFQFSKALTSRKVFVPWWETLIYYTHILMTIISSYLVYSMEPEKYFVCEAMNEVEESLNLGPIVKSALETTCFDKFTKQWLVRAGPGNWCLVGCVMALIPTVVWNIHPDVDRLFRIMKSFREMLQHSKVDGEMVEKLLTRLEKDSVAHDKTMLERMEVLKETADLKNRSKVFLLYLLRIIFSVSALSYCAAIPVFVFSEGDHAFTCSDVVECHSFVPVKYRLLLVVFFIGATIEIFCEALSLGLIFRFRSKNDMELLCYFTRHSNAVDKHTYAIWESLNQRRFERSLLSPTMNIEKGTFALMPSERPSYSSKTGFHQTGELGQPTNSLK